MTLHADTPVRAEQGRPRQAAIARLVGYALPALDAGRLRVILPNGDVVSRAGAAAGPEATLVVRRWRALWRMLRGGEHGFSDGYVNGEWTTPDLGALLQLGALNERTINRRGRGSVLTRLRNRILHRSHDNTLHGSRRNIAAHYDLGNAFYAHWLDSGMNYSSALYEGDEPLESAQLAKLDRAAELLDLSGGECTLEIGCGWGALAERLIGRYGATVKGLTLSLEQLAYCRERLSGRPFEGKLQDYRHETGRYDRIVSVEMLEAVGERFWPAYFAKLRQCLTETGVAVLQVITIRDDRYEAYRSQPDFIQRYIFPGGMLPTPAIIEREAANQGLTLVHRESFGESYARTLAEWRSRFLNAWPAIEPLGFDARFRRMWEYYLTYCEVGFNSGLVDVGFFKLVPR
jgi:cyclopropane-fatty-acyl-phospholipid synthase